MEAAQIIGTTWTHRFNPTLTTFHVRAWEYDCSGMVELVDASTGKWVRRDYPRIIAAMLERNGYELVIAEPVQEAGTAEPQDDTLYEVIGADHVTIRYFASGDDAHAYAATIPGAKAVIYLQPTEEPDEEITEDPEMVAALNRFLARRSGYRPLSHGGWVNIDAARWEDGSGYRPLSHGGWFVDENGDIL